MRARVLVVTTALFVLATMGPTTQAGDGFWHAPAESDLKGMLGAYDTQEDIHALLLAALAENGGFFTMPLGDIVYGTPAGPVPGTRGVTIYKPRKCWNGYTYINSMPLTPAGNRNCLIDMKGNIVNDSWKLMGYGPVPAAEGVSKILPGGHVVGSIREGPNGTGAAKLVQLDWNGDLVHEWRALVHHDHQRQGNPCGYYAPYQTPKTMGGKVLTLEFSFPDKSKTSHISGYDVIDDRIRIMSWGGKGLDKPEFDWYARDHYEDLVPDKAGQNATRLGLNFLPGFFIGPEGPPDNVLREDWVHGNAVAWLGPNKWWSQHYDPRFHPENIMADFRSLNVTIIIARYDHPYKKWLSGDIVWQLGPDYSTAGDDGKVGQIIGQHMAHMIPMYMPGEGNILIFDNGGAGGYGALIEGLTSDDGGTLTKLGTFPNKYRLFSRILEINPITKQIEWEYKQPKPTTDLNNDGFYRGNERLFYSSIMSGCQRLPNGNTLISEATVGRTFEVTRKGEVVWEYLLGWANPLPGPGGLFGAINQSAIYRSYRVPHWWIPKHPVKGKHGKKGKSCKK